MAQEVSVVLTLREEARSVDGIEKVKEAAEAMGLTPTSSGFATICCRVSTKMFEQLFGRPVVEVTSSKITAIDKGSPPGFAAMSLPIAEALQPWVEDVSILPPAIRMGGMP